VKVIEPNESVISMRKCEGLCRLWNRARIEWDEESGGRGAGLNGGVKRSLAQENKSSN
jgi:hypothetical protein